MTTLHQLWFDKIWKYNTTIALFCLSYHCCGLIKFGNTIQLNNSNTVESVGCGLIKFGNTIQLSNTDGYVTRQLWFDKIWKYNTTLLLEEAIGARLWFDKIWKYNTTFRGWKA